MPARPKRCAAKPNRKRLTGSAPEHSPKLWRPHRRPIDVHEFNGTLPTNPLNQHATCIAHRTAGPCVTFGTECNRSDPRQTESADIDERNGMNGNDDIATAHSSDLLDALAVEQAAAQTHAINELLGYIQAANDTENAERG